MAVLGNGYYQAFVFNLTLRESEYSIAEFGLSFCFGSYFIVSRMHNWLCE